MAGNCISLPAPGRVAFTSWAMACQATVEHLQHCTFPRVPHHHPMHLPSTTIPASATSPTTMLHQLGAAFKSGNAAEVPGVFNIHLTPEMRLAQEVWQ